MYTITEIQNKRTSTKLTTFFPYRIQPIDQHAKSTDCWFMLCYRHWRFHILETKAKQSTETRRKLASDRITPLNYLVQAIWDDSRSAAISIFPKIFRK